MGVIGSRLGLMRRCQGISGPLNTMCAPAPHSVPMPKLASREECADLVRLLTLELIEGL